MRPSSVWLCPIPALGLVLLAALSGCGSGGDSKPAEVAAPEATIELQNDLGEVVDAFPEGGAVFVSFADLDPWTAYEVTLRAPGASAVTAAQQAAEQAHAERMGTTKGHGPSESTAGPEGEKGGATGSVPMGPGPSGELGGDAPDMPDAMGPGLDSPGAGLNMSRSTSIGTNAVAAPQDEAGPADLTPVEGPQEAPAEAAGEATEAEPSAEEGVESAEEAGPQGADAFPAVDRRDEAQQAADAIAPPPEMPRGNVIGGGTFISDAGGAIPPTLLARDLGIAPNAGLGRYTVSIKAVGGRDWGGLSFDVVRSEDPFCYPCTPDGTLRTVFSAGEETLYVRAENLPPHAEVDVYVLSERGTYTQGEQLEDVSGSITYAQADEEGRVLIDVWTGCDQPGAYDLFVDLNNNMAIERSVSTEDGTQTKDILYGGRTVGLVITEQAAVRGELDLSTQMACTDAVYTEGLKPRLGSDKSLYIRAIPTFVGAPLPSEATVYVMAHKDSWQTGDPLQTVTGTPVKTLSMGPWGLERTLVWPAPILPGNYDIIIDVDGNGEYTRGVDLIDNASARDGEVQVGCVVTDAGNLIAVRGKVVDSAGEPIQGALVSSSGAAGGPVETAADGTYTLLQVLPRRVEIEAAAASYQRGKVLVDGKPSTEAIEAQSIRLAAVSSPGNDYMPLASGNEWEYDLSRTIDGGIPVGPLADYVGPIGYAGTMLRYVGGPDTSTIPTLTLLPLTEEESVFVTTQSSEGSGDRAFARTCLIEPASDGLLFRETSEASPRTWLPATLSAGSEFSAWVPVGPYRVLGTGTIKTAGTVSVPAGDFANAIKVEVSVGDIVGEGIHSTHIAGTLACYYAPGIGEVKREVDLTINIDTTGLGMGDSLFGSVTLTERLALKRYALAQSQGGASSAEPPAATATEPAAPEDAEEATEESAAEPAEPAEAEPTSEAPDAQARLGARRTLTAF